MNLLNAICWPPPGLAVVLVHRLTGRAWLAPRDRRPAGHDPDRLVDRDARRRPRPPSRAVRLPARAARRLGAPRAGWPAADRPAARRGGGVFALALGNHSLVLLFGPGIVLFVFAVAPEILRRRRLVAGCLVALGLTLVVVYLELPLRAGPFRAPLVYGHPETWGGFWYIVLAQQFEGSLVDPFGDLGPKAAALVGLAARQLGPLVVLVPLGFVATVVRRPRYALLTGTTLALTCWFAASYDNARDRALLPRPAAHRRDLARPARRRRRAMVSSACSPRAASTATARGPRLPVVGFALAALDRLPDRGWPCPSAGGRSMNVPSTTPRTGSTPSSTSASPDPTRSSSRGGVTRPRYGTHSGSRVVVRTSGSWTTGPALTRTSETSTT